MHDLLTRLTAAGGPRHPDPRRASPALRLREPPHFPPEYERLFRARKLPSFALPMLQQSATKRKQPFGQQAAGQASASVEVVPVDSRRRWRQFLRLPLRLYQNDPCWVAPLEREERAMLDRRHPFFLHGEAALFLALRGGRPVGRIVASDDPRYNAQRDENLGCFGRFECIDDPGVAHALLDTAADWLRQRGRDRVRGPVNYSSNYTIGLLIDGFNTPPRIMMSHNPPYYARLLESWGLEKAKDLYAWWFDGKSPRLERWQQRVDRLAARGGVRVRPVRMNDFDAEMARCLTVYNRMLAEHWGFVRMTDEEFQHMAQAMRRIADPGLVLIAEIDDEPVGFSLTLPDWNEALGHIRGRLTRFGLPIPAARLLYHARRIQTARMAVLGVDDRYRRRGVAELLILNTFRYGKDQLGYTGAELSWTLEDNILINRTIEAVGGQRYKTYRIYERSLV